MFRKRNKYFFETSQDIHNEVYFQNSSIFKQILFFYK